MTERAPAQSSGEIDLGDQLPLSLLREWGRAGSPPPPQPWLMARTRVGQARPTWVLTLQPPRSARWMPNTELNFTSGIPACLTLVLGVLSFLICKMGVLAAA